jgi:hypothetical protein
MEVSSLSLETKCGWKGVLKSGISIMPTYSLWSTNGNEDSVGTYKNDVRSSAGDVVDTGSGSRSEETDLSTIATTATTGEIPTLQDISLNWMGGEPSKYGDDVEQKGVFKILTALTKQEREDIQSFDMSMPIRHFRAEKVCTLLFISSAANLFVMIFDESLTLIIEI